MAPEIIENWKVHKNGAEGSEYLRSADVFSATIVLWECLSALIPYEGAKDPDTGYSLFGSMLGDHIVAGLRPSTGTIPNGCGGVVTRRMQAVVECGWHHDPETRPSAADIGARLEEEISECQVLATVVGTRQELAASTLPRDLSVQGSVISV